MAGFSLNTLAGRLADRMIEEAAELRIALSRGGQGETLLACGGQAQGGIEAGLRLAQVCMSGLVEVSLHPSDALPRWPWHVVVRTSQPVTACLASQYAGWALKR